MSMQQSKALADIRRVGSWTLAVPVLALWPFLSALPIFSLIGGSGNALQISIQLVLLAAGFWGVAGAYVLFLLLKVQRPEANLPTRVRVGDGRMLGLAIYAGVWTVLYLIYAMVAR